MQEAATPRAATSTPLLLAVEIMVTYHGVCDEVKTLGNAQSWTQLR